MVAAVAAVALAGSAAASSRPVAGARCAAAGARATSESGTLRCARTAEGLRWVRARDRRHAQTRESSTGTITATTAPTTATTAPTITTTTSTTTTTTSTTMTTLVVAPASLTVALVVNSPGVCEPVRLTWSAIGVGDTGIYAVQWVPSSEATFNSYTQRAVQGTSTEFNSMLTPGVDYRFRVWPMRVDWDGGPHAGMHAAPHSNEVEARLAKGCAPAPATTTTVAATYTVTYNGNTPTSGSVPTDTTAYASGATVTASNNTGALARTGYEFGGWCTTQPAAGSACGGTSRAGGSTFSISENVTLYAVWLNCASGGTCALGDTGPGGGVVFYVAGATFTSTGSDCGTSCRYLEAQPAVIQTGLWCSVNTNQNVRSEAIGGGYANTSTAQALCTSGAIRAAFDYQKNGKTDWHLPSFGELTQIYNQRNLAGIDIGSPAVYYWSSSECNFGFGCSGTSARMYRFSDGATNIYGGKTGLSDVRYLIVRAF